VTNDNSGTTELQNFRQKHQSTDASQHDHLALSVEIIENSNSSDSNLEPKDIDNESVGKQDLDVPKQDSFNAENVKSSGASFSSHSLDRTSKLPTS